MVARASINAGSEGNHHKMGNDNKGNSQVRDSMFNDPLMASKPTDKSKLLPNNSKSECSWNCFCGLIYSICCCCCIKDPGVSDN